MKQFLIAFTLLASLSSQAGQQSSAAPGSMVAPEPPPVDVPSQLVIDDAPNRANPIQFVLVDRYSDRMSDEQGNTRLRLSGKRIMLYNSGNFLINSYEISEEEQSHLELVFSKVSRTCPVAITVDRASKQVRRVTPKCDELSALKVEENLG